MILAGDIGGMAMLLFLLLEFPNQRRYAQVLFFGLVGAGMAGVLHAAHPLPLFLAGWRRGAAYGAFFLALTTLRDAAETSKLVRRCGAHLVAQPPGRRYAAHVIEIGAEGEFALNRDVKRGRPDVRTFRVRVGLDRVAPELRPGMTAEVRRK